MIFAELSFGAEAAVPLVLAQLRGGEDLPAAEVFVLATPFMTEWALLLVGENFRPALFFFFAFKSLSMKEGKKAARFCGP